MIAIHKTKGSFSERWIDYCDNNGISYKIVDCYKNDIISQLEGCSALMWHHNHMITKDIVFANQLLFALEHSGMVVFPDFKTNWHFDDKLGQKYLLEKLNCSLVNTYVFYDKNEALEWARTIQFPKVFKLRSGGGSWNVVLVKSKNEANKIIQRAFGCGFSQYNPFSNQKERWRKFKLGKLSFLQYLKGFYRFFVKPDYALTMGNERGYVLFQDFIANNDSDIRVVVIEDKAFAIKRMNRKNDFRASGSGDIFYEKKLFDDKVIQLAFDLTSKVKGQSIAIDFVIDNGNPKVVEICFGFVPGGYDKCEGFWDNKLIWHNEQFNPYGWMVDNVIKKIETR
jgi:glutathione synthase/RimK-type ligase-like ATP-grasp enzyme